MQSIEIFLIPANTCSGQFLLFTHRELLQTINSEIYPDSCRDDGDFGMAAKSIRLRDIRKMDFVTNQSESFSITVRKHVVLLTADPVRVIVTASSLYVFIQNNSNGKIIAASLQIDTKEWLAACKQFTLLYKDDIQPNSVSNETTSNSFSQLESYANLSFAAHAYESVLALVTTLQSQNVHLMHAQAREALGFLKKSPLLSFEQQEKFRCIKLLVVKEENKLSMYRQGLRKLLDEEELLAMMNLHIFQRNSECYRYPLTPQILASHDYLEDILHPLFMDLSATSASVMTLKHQLLAAEDSTTLRLDIMENVSLLANKSLQTLMVAIAISNVITAAGGMNIRHGAPYGSFSAVLLISLSIIPVTYILLYWMSTKSRLVRKGI